MENLHKPSSEIEYAFEIVTKMFDKYLCVRPKKFDMARPDRMCYLSIVGHLVEKNITSENVAKSSLELSRITGYSPSLSRVSTGEFSPAKCGVLAEIKKPVESKKKILMRPFYWVKDTKRAKDYLHLLGNPFHGRIPEELAIGTDFERSRCLLIAALDEINLAQLK